MKRLASLLALAVVALAPAAAQRSPGARPVAMGMPGTSMADVLLRRAAVLTDTLALDDGQQTRLRSLLADRLDTLAAQAAKAPRDERRRAPTRPRGRPDGGAMGGFPERRDRAAFRPNRFDALHEPLFATLDPAVRALLTPEQAARYDAFRTRERERAEALQAERPPRGHR